MHWKRMCMLIKRDLETEKREWFRNGERSEGEREGKLG